MRRRTPVHRVKRRIVHPIIPCPHRPVGRLKLPGSTAHECSLQRLVRLHPEKSECALAASVARSYATSTSFASHQGGGRCPTWQRRQYPEYPRRNLSVRGMLHRRGFPGGSRAAGEPGQSDLVLYRTSSASSSGEPVVHFFVVSERTSVRWLV